MNQVEEFEKVVEEAKNQPVKVVVVTGKPGSGKSKVLREAAADKKWVKFWIPIIPMLFCWTVCKLCLFRCSILILPNFWQNSVKNMLL